MKKLYFVFFTIAVAAATSAITAMLLKPDNNYKPTFAQNRTPSQTVALHDRMAMMETTDFTNPIEKSMPAVVHIKSMRSARNKTSMEESPLKDFFGEDFYNHYFNDPKKGEQSPRIMIGTGSGVIISNDGYIVTNNHVVTNADEIEITLNDNTSKTATVIGTDPSTDLALLKIEEADLPYINFANSDDVKVGEWVLALGNPFNLNSTATAGIVSAKARNINILKDKYAIESFIQTDAAINPGNSGGALVNLKGELIGINTAIASPTGSYSGYGFAVPANIVEKVITDLKDFGVVQRGFLGVMILSVNSAIAQEKGLDVLEGVYVESMNEESAAKTAGIEVGDVIVEANGTKTKTSPELQEVIGRHKPGDTVEIVVDRKGKFKTYNVVLTNKDGKIKKITKNDIAILDVLGIEIENIDNETKEKLEIENGVIVTKIVQGKISKHTNMKTGFIITKIDKTLVKDADHFKEILKNKKGGTMLEGIYPDIPGDFYFAFGM